MRLRGYEAEFTEPWGVGRRSSVPQTAAKPYAGRSMGVVKTRGREQNNELNRLSLILYLT